MRKEAVIADFRVLSKSLSGEMENYVRISVSGL
jgi:hypothetical protein